MSKGWGYAAKVSLIALSVLVVPAAALEGFFYLLWWNEGVNGTAAARAPFAWAILPTALWLTPVVATVVILVIFFSGDVDGSEK